MVGYGTGAVAAFGEREVLGTVSHFARDRLWKRSLDEGADVGVVYTLLVGSRHGRACGMRAVRFWESAWNVWYGRGLLCEGTRAFDRTVQGAGIGRAHVQPHRYVEASFRIDVVCKPETSRRGLWHGRHVRVMEFTLIEHV